MFLIGTKFWMHRGTFICLSIFLPVSLLLRQRSGLHFVIKSGTNQSKDKSTVLCVRGEHLGFQKPKNGYLIRYLWTVTIHIPFPSIHFNLKTMSIEDAAIAECNFLLLLIFVFWVYGTLLKHMLGVQPPSYI